MASLVWPQLGCKLLCWCLPSSEHNGHWLQSVLLLRWAVATMVCRNCHVSSQALQAKPSASHVADPVGLGLAAARACHAYKCAVHAVCGCDQALHLEEMQSGPGRLRLRPEGLDKAMEWLAEKAPAQLVSCTQHCVAQLDTANTGATAWHSARQCTCSSASAVALSAAAAATASGRLNVHY